MSFYVLSTNKKKSSCEQNQNTACWKCVSAAGSRKKYVCVVLWDVLQREPWWGCHILLNRQHDEMGFGLPSLELLIISSESFDLISTPWQQMFNFCHTKTFQVKLSILCLLQPAYSVFWSTYTEYIWFSGRLEQCIVKMTCTWSWWVAALAILMDFFSFTYFSHILTLKPELSVLVTDSGLITCAHFLKNHYYTSQSPHFHSSASGGAGPCGGLWAVRHMCWVSELWWPPLWLVCPL